MTIASDLVEVAIQIALEYSQELIMQCPHCKIGVGFRWQPLCAITDEKGDALEKPAANLAQWHKAGWAICSECEKFVLGIWQFEYSLPEDPLDTSRVLRTTSGSWWAVPHLASEAPRDAATLPKEYAANYDEAYRVLPISYRAAAAFGRQVLTDLLADHGYPSRRLSQQIKAFIADGKAAVSLTDNLKAFQTMADFGLHTKKDEEGQIVEVELEEAEWTLGVVERFIDYFLSGPDLDQEMQARAAAKRHAAGEP
ncbi:MAG: hypothetical protein WEB00_08065 [Dehalococcoidia bacterium]